MDQPMSLRQRIRRGRQFLVEICDEDFGYDLRRWHEHLKQSRDGGYAWSRHIDLPRVMKEALASLEWQQEVCILGKSSEQANAPERRRSGFGRTNKRLPPPGDR